jgi:hypothetical protein
VIFYTRTGLKKKPHPKKSKLSIKEKERLYRENQTVEERQISKRKDKEDHICSRQHEEKIQTAGKTS